MINYSFNLTQIKWANSESIALTKYNPVCFFLWHVNVVFYEWTFLTHARVRPF